MIRVAYNMLSVDPRGGGVTTYAVALARTLAERDDVDLVPFVGPDGAHLVDGLRADVRVLGAGRGRRARYTASVFAELPIAARRAGCAILHSPANFGPCLAPGVVCVATVHDVIWEQAGLAWGSAAAIREMRVLSRLTVPRMRRVITGSHDAAGQIRRVLGVDERRIDVIPDGVETPTAAPADAQDLRCRFGLGEGPIVLSVAQMRPYKRLDALVRACARLDTPFELVLPGSHTPFTAELVDLARSLGIERHVHVPGWVDAADLEGLYAAALCAVQPSTVEGFGFPVLEAMLRRVPVACSGRGAMAEVAGGAAVLFDPDDEDDVARGLRTLVVDADARARCIEAGVERAAAFTWERTADGVVDAYRRALVG